jgi:hypothetical protein
MPKTPRKDSPESDASILKFSSALESDDLVSLNFRVPAHFHREFKVYAVQHDMSMVELVQHAFHFLKTHPKR